MCPALIQILSLHSLIMSLALSIISFGHAGGPWHCQGYPRQCWNQAASFPRTFALLQTLELCVQPKLTLLFTAELDPFVQIPT